jgi:hypothetical protein
MGGLASRGKVYNQPQSEESLLNIGPGNRQRHLYNSRLHQPETLSDDNEPNMPNSSSNIDDAAQKAIWKNKIKTAVQNAGANGAEVTEGKYQ